MVGPGAAGPSAWPGTGTAPETLLVSRQQLGFSSGIQPGAQWTADQMQGGTYIFIYLDGGLCLASPPSPPASATLENCNLQASQRWLRQQLTVGAGGLDYYQLRNVADGRCLTAAGPAGQAARVQACQPVADWRQLVTFVSS